MYGVDRPDRRPLQQIVRPRHPWTGRISNDKDRAGKWAKQSRTPGRNTSLSCGLVNIGLVSWPSVQNTGQGPGHVLSNAHVLREYPTLHHWSSQSLLVNGALRVRTNQSGLPLTSSSIPATQP
jgi:hypothetical protein